MREGRQRCAEDRKGQATWMCILSLHPHQQHAMQAWQQGTQQQANLLQLCSLDENAIDALSRVWVDLHNLARGEQSRVRLQRGRENRQRWQR